VSVEPEVALTGGRSTAGVVRVGDTVRRPVGPHSPFVHRLLRLLEEKRVDAAPRFHGLDEDGREILAFRDGWVPPNLEWRCWHNDQIVAAASIVRRLHDATEGSPLAEAPLVACHGDLGPCNFVFVDGRPRFVIDFDRAHPDTRKSDVAYMAWLWLVGREDEPGVPPLARRLSQLTLLLDAYGLDDRIGFATAIEIEQRELLARAVKPATIEWVKIEIAFVRAHAAEIDAAANRGS